MLFIKTTIVTFFVFNILRGIKWINATSSVYIWGITFLGIREFWEPWYCFHHRYESYVYTFKVDENKYPAKALPNSKHLMELININPKKNKTFYSFFICNSPNSAEVIKKWVGWEIAK